MTTERLYEFHILATTLNFSRAAGQLFISQSVLSRHLQEMEQELGVSLFVRDTHNVSLTEEGEFLFGQTRSLLKKADQAVYSLSLGNIEAEESVSVLCQEQTLCPQILKAMDDFQNQYPQIRLQITPGLTASSIGLLNDCDLMLSPCDFTDRLGIDIEAYPIWSQTAYLAVRNDHPLSNEQEVSLSDLRNENLLIPYADEMFGPYAQNGQLVFQRCRGAVRRIAAANAQEALLSVELGRGIMILPASFVKRVYTNTRIIRITDTECVFPVYVYINGKTAGTGARDLLKMLTSLFAVEPAFSESSFQESENRSLEAAG